MELKFTLKDTKEKQTLLNAVCYFRSKRIKATTWQVVFVETWNAKMQRCEVSNKFSDRVNRVSKKVNRFLDAVMELWEERMKDYVPTSIFKTYDDEDYIKHSLKCILGSVAGKQVTEEKRNIPLLFTFSTSMWKT